MRSVDPRLLFHTDRGGEFTSTFFRAALKGIAARHSLSRTGDCYDNAAMESFFGTMKDELDISEGRIFDSPAEAEAIIGEYIEGYYNRQRRHSRIGYANPWRIMGESSRCRSRRRLEGPFDSLSVVRLRDGLHVHLSSQKSAD